MKKQIDRRKFLIKSALSFGSLRLKSLVTGIPLAVLASPRAFAAGADHKFLIMSHFQAGDPINTNGPGTYPLNPNDQNDPLRLITHPNVDGFKTPTSVSFGDKQYLAAQPWSTLPQDLRDRMGLWQHGTFVNAHADFPKTMQLNGGVSGIGDLSNSSEQLGAMIAQEMATNLGTVIDEPMSLGGTAVSSRSIRLPILKPIAIKEMFQSSFPDLEKMMRLRNHFVDTTYKDVKLNGTPAQKEFLDTMITTRGQAQSVADSIGTLTDGVTGNDPIDQIKMILALIQIKMSPVFTFGIPFGGDNHTDVGLAQEVAQTNSGMVLVNTLWTEIKKLGLEDDVVFATLNTFGRTYLEDSLKGRDHNSLNHSMMVFGSTIKPGVIGGIEPHIKNGQVVDFKSSSINSVTGTTEGQTDIPLEESLVSVGKTLSKAVGMDEQRIHERISKGKIITGALV
ncbi:DUF1501 domain-containing protein [Marinicellulosiphila megalodicopiae]|uniref:DUF1501 domain-containing protein n=1 Tax=Marinicellulosiphila megalodicopiae TaxID=2724896 RepID=UPI003BB12A19